MSHRIVIERDDGGVSITELSGEILATLASDGGAMHAEIDKIALASGFTVKSWHESDVASLPADRTFRDAWHHAGSGKVEVHMDRARAIHLDRLRVARAPALAALDVEYQRADERGDVAAKAAVAKRKQALRDLPAALKLEQHATPEALAAAWPADLPRPA